MANRSITEVFSLLQTVKVIPQEEAMSNKYAMTQRAPMWGECFVAVKSEDYDVHRQALLDIYAHFERKEKLVSFKFLVETIYELIAEGSKELHIDLAERLSATEVKTYRIARPIYGWFRLKNSEILKHGRYSFIPQELIKEHFEKHFSPGAEIFHNKEGKYSFCYFETECVAKDDVRACEIFKSQYNQVSNCLKFIFYDRNIYQGYGEFYDKQNDVGVGYDDYVISCSDGRKYPRFSSCSGKPSNCVCIDDDYRRYNSMHRFWDKENEEFDSRIWGLLDKSDHNEIEKRVLRAIDWIAMAIGEEQPSIAFVQCAFAIEHLLLHQEGFITKSIVAQISEYAAFIVGHDKDSRKDVADTFKQLYGIRSKIAHGIQADSIDSELQEIVWLSKQIVINLLIKPELKGITTTKMLGEWITNMRYTT
jgi:hypothetical protein